MNGYLKDGLNANQSPIVRAVLSNPMARMTADPFEIPVLAQSA